MAKQHVLRLSKHYGCNVAGEVAGFSPGEAAHILKHEGGEELAVIELGRERYDLQQKRVVTLEPSKQPAGKPDKP